jgi:phosphoglycolate phosphatase
VNSSAIKPRINLVAFDVAGTTVNDDGLVVAAFKAAFEKSQPELWREKGAIWTQYAIDTMGQSKIHVFTELLGDIEKAHAANVAFEEAYMNEVAEQGISPIAGTLEIFADLRERGIAIALTTGFSRSTLDPMLFELGWLGLIDASVTPEEAGRGRPHPDMLNFLANKLNIQSPELVMVVGDTAADMQSGVAFGATNIVGVLSGAHSRETLHDAGATSVINSVADLSSHI